MYNSCPVLMIRSKKCIVRKRTPKACIRCYSVKRKCDHAKPSCTRCKKSNVKCEYFSEKQVLERSLQRRSRALCSLDYHSNSPVAGSAGIDSSNLPDTELNPITRDSEAPNFKLIVNSTGEYSKYLPSALFPFAEPSNNVSYIVDRLPKNQDRYVIFDFGSVPAVISSLEELKKFMPNRNHCDHLIEYFFENIYPLIPILDKEEFELKYYEYWKDSNKFHDLNALILFYGIIFSSCVAIQITTLYLTGKRYHKENSLDYEELKYRSFQCVENIKFMMNMRVSPSMSSLAASAIMYYVSSMNCYGTAGEVSSLLRYCQITGLHRRIGIATDTTPVRDFLYSYILYLDTLVSYYNGLPSSINKETFETTRIFPTRTTDLKTLHSLNTLHNGLMWADLLFQLNKIEKANEDDFSRLNQEFLKSQDLINSIGDEILASFPSMPGDYLKWLVCEGRLGLRKSALLVHALRNSLFSNENSKKHKGLHSYDLVLQSMLLINESLMKVVLGLKHNPNLLWFIRNSYPFQAISIVLTHIQKNPSEEINFKNLDSKIQYSVHPEINYLHGDIRIILVQKVFEALGSIKTLWPTFMQKRYDKVFELKNYVLGETSSSLSSSKNEGGLDDIVDNDDIFDQLLKGLLEGDNGRVAFLFQGIDSHLQTN